MHKTIILFIYGIFFFFSILGLVSLLTGCSQEEPTAADTMPPVGSKEISLVFEAVKIMSPLQVRSEGSRIDVVLNEKEITEKIYNTTATAICIDQLNNKARFDPVGEIRVWNKGKFQGWAMLLPAKQCDDFAGSKQGENVIKDRMRKLTSDDIGSF